MTMQLEHDRSETKCPRWVNRRLIPAQLLWAETLLHGMMRARIEPQ